MKQPGLQLPCIHVGFHKSASTTLQHHLFAKHPQVMNVGRPSPDPRAFQVCDAILNASLRDKDQRVPMDIPFCRALWQEVVAEAKTSDKLLVLSRERLTRYFFFQHPGDTSLPEAMHSVFGPARIVIVVRNQLKLLESLYLHKAKSYQYHDPDDWLRLNREGDVTMHKYSEVAQSYSSVFGDDNVRVMLFEELATDPDGFAKQLCPFIGIDAEIGSRLLSGKRENARRTQRSLMYSKIRRSFLPNTPIGHMVPGPIRNMAKRFINGGEKARIRFSDAWNKEIEEFHRRDNQILAERYQLALADHGYPL